MERGGKEEMKGDVGGEGEEGSQRGREGKGKRRQRGKGDMAKGKGR